jgi:hypothetical protein
MMQRNVAIKVSSYIIKDLILDVLYWPIWWYSSGLIDAFFRLIDTVSQGNRELALSIWVKNFFVPMYGDFSWEGRLISLLMRFLQVILRGFLYLMWIFYALVVFFLWLAVPVFTIYQIIFNIGLLK